MADEIYINTGTSFQQPYQGQAVVNAQSPETKRTPARTPANARQPNTYQHRQPGTYRNPVSAQEPNIRNAQQPITYKFKVTVYLSTQVTVYISGNWCITLHCKWSESVYVSEPNQ